MCGIVGYVGKKKALPILIDGLKRLEYRGYDSAGIVIVKNGEIIVEKSAGKVSELEKKTKKLEEAGKLDGTIGVAHTRWATHGKATKINAHPHTSCDNKVWIVHNGIVENYSALKDDLIERGHKFKSETDSEVIAHLIEENYKGNLKDAVSKTIKLLEGTYSIIVVHKDEPENLVIAKCGSPIVIGVGEDETIIASDIDAIIKYTNKIIYLEDKEIVVVNHDGFTIFNLNNKIVNRKAKTVNIDLNMMGKGDFPHFMLKEIFDQPETVKDAIKDRLLLESGNVKLESLDSVKKRLFGIERIVVVACGTAYNAGLVGEYMIEEFAGISVEVEYASEFRYRNPVLNKKTAVIAISQSGETADTLAAVREAKSMGILTIGIINSVGSTIARETDVVIYNNAGPEISVASTKAFTSQVVVLAMLTVYLGRQRKMTKEIGMEIVKEINNLPIKISKTLELNKKVKEIAKKYYLKRNFAFLGRKYNSPLASEGALKLKELTYIHAEGFVSGELKHGPIAMIDKNFPSIFIAPKDSVYEKNLSNMEEIKSRSGIIIAIATEGDEEVGKISDEVIYIPKTLEMLTPLLIIIPLQFFAYHMTILNGKDVDKPRNLAKSVTVE